MKRGRRILLQGGIALLALIGVPRAILAGVWPRQAFASTAASEALVQLFGTAKTTHSDEITLNAPLVAEDGTIVPITVGTTLRGVKSISIVVNNNPRPLAVGQPSTFVLNSLPSWGQAALKVTTMQPNCLVQIFLKDPEPQLIHTEIVLHNGVPVGEVRAGSYGHTLGGAVGLAMIEGDPVDAAYLDEGKWEVDIAGKLYPAEVSLKPLYDPGMEKIRS